MKIWQWLSHIPPAQKSLIIKEEDFGKDPSISYILSYMESSSLSRASGVENITRELLREIEDTDKWAIKSIVHEALGRIFFEKGLYAAALYQFEEALKNLKKAFKKEGRTVDDEALAKIYAWIGLCSLKTNEFRKAVDAFSESIKILKKRNPNIPILGELHALYADALSFVSPNEALEEFELAHELLLRNPSPIFISNAMKLFAALVFRKHFEEAASILSDLAYKALSSMKGMNIGIYESFQKVMRNTYLKALRIVEAGRPIVIEKLLLGVEAIKGLYFLFRSFLKPALSFREVESINTTILAAVKLGNIKLYESLMNKKEYLDRLRDFTGLSSFRLRMVNQDAFARNLEALRTKYKDVLVISLTKLLKSREYLFISHAFFHKEFDLVTKVFIDDSFLELRHEEPNVISKELAHIIPIRLLEQFSKIDKNWLVILSLDGSLHEIPWELIPTNTAKESFLALRCPVTRVVSLQQIITWSFNYPKKHGNIALMELPPDRDDENRLVRSMLRRIGYRVYSNIRDGFNMLTTESIGVLYYGREPIRTLDDQPIIKLGNLILMIHDIERLDLLGRLAILNIDNGVEIVEDNIGYHSLPIAFNMAGFESVIATLAEIDYKSKLLLPKIIFGFQNPKDIGYRLYMLRKILYNADNPVWYRYVLYGSPLTVI
ncbi:MAG: hypothetical protein ACTSVA_01515 [Candidatus Njordarchaeales archaeon]